MTQDLKAMAEKFLSAWNSKNSESVMDQYSDHFTYRDPNTKGSITDKEAFRRYLDKLFLSWEMHYSLKECFPLNEKDGVTVIWDASFKRKGHPKTLVVQGMDIILFDGDLIARNEVFFDRMVLMPIAAPLITKIQKLRASKLVRKNPLVKGAIQFGQQIRDRLPGEIEKGRTYLEKKRKEVRKHIAARFGSAPKVKTKTSAGTNKSKQNEITT